MTTDPSKPQATTTVEQERSMPMTNHQNLCGAPTPSGPCQRPASAPGRCGVNHTQVGSVATMAAPSPLATATAQPSAPPVVASSVGQNLAGANLSECQWGERPVLHRANLAEANGNDARIDAVFTHSSFRHAQLASAHLVGPHVASDFSASDLTGASLPDNDRGTFAGARLVGATARGRTLHQTNWAGANVNGMLAQRCDLSGADLSGAVGFDNAVWRQCFYDDQTRFPDGYDADGRGWIRAQSDPVTDERRQSIWRDAEQGRFDPYDLY